MTFASVSSCFALSTHCCLCWSQQAALRWTVCSVSLLAEKAAERLLTPRSHFCQSIAPIEISGQCQAMLRSLPVVLLKRCT